MKYLTPKTRVACLLGASVIAAALSTVSFAQSATTLANTVDASAGSGVVASQTQKSAARAAEIDARLAAARELVATFSSDATRAGLSNGWQVDLMQAVLSLPAASIRELKGAETLRDAQKTARQVRSALSAATRGVGAEQAKSLGDSALDLVFTPVTPCRVLDTRASVKIQAGVTLGVDMDGGNAGNAAGCTHAGVGGPEVQGYAINVTVTETGSNGFLQVQPAGATPGSSWLNWTATNTTVANQGIVRNLQNSGSEFSIRSNVTDTHVLVDWFGYFGPPTTLPSLTCSVVLGTPVSLAANSGGTNVPFPACPTGVRTGVYCQTANFDSVVAGNNTGQCNFRNSSASVYNVRADAICCSVTP